jgi:hypothetical protein
MPGRQLFLPRVQRAQVRGMARQSRSERRHRRKRHEQADQQAGLQAVNAAAQRVTVESRAANRPERPAALVALGSSKSHHNHLVQ